MYDKLARKHHLQWLGPQPSNIYNLTRWQCKDRHVFEACYDNIKHGDKCGVCHPEESNIKRCKRCKKFLPLTSFYYDYKFLKAGRKKYYHTNCNTCDRVVYPRKRIPADKNQSACQRHYHKRQDSGVCLRCNNTTKSYFLCRQCYIVQWMTVRLRWIKYWHPASVPTVQQHYDVLRKNIDTILKLPMSHSFPTYRLSSIRSMKKYPQDALLITNLQWKKRKTDRRTLEHGKQLCNTI